MAEKLLVIDDDEPMCRLVEAIFTREGFDVIAAPDGPSGLRRAQADRPDVVLLDLRLPGPDGLHVLEAFRKTLPAVPVVMLTGSRDIRNAVRATHLGASDYLTKPVDRDEVVLVVRRALETRALRREVETLRRQIGNGVGESLAVTMGSSPPIRQVIDRAATVATSNFTVLILGETGTGKELVARAIHQMSDRRSRPFVALDCGAVPEALLESELFGHEKGAFTGAERRKQGRLRLAEGGTCLLDEIGNLPMSLQGKLLRVLESREVQPVGADRASPMDVRFVAATNDDLQARVARGLFRADLYFRLAQYTITVPPLRGRLDDIAHLAGRFLEEVSFELRRPIQAMVPDALELLRRYPWPGNVRELRNVIRQAVLESRELVVRPDVIRAALDSARPAGQPGASTGPAEQSLKEIAGEAVRTAERKAIADTLRATGGNKSQAARLLKVDYKTLHLKMRHLGIHARDFAR